MSPLPLLLLTGCADPALPPCAVDAPAPSPLRADGRILRDDQDRQVLLRGVNAGGRSKFAPYAPFDFDDDYQAALDAYLDRAAGWGFDVLRVPFSWQALEPTRGTWDEEWAARYDALLDGAWRRGLWTIVDFHQDIYAENFCGDGFPAWTLDDPPAPHHDCPSWFTAYATDDDVAAAFDAFWEDTAGTRTAFRDMWAFMADRHADRPGVIGYEIINEPSPGNRGEDAWEEDTLAPFFGEMAALVQGVDPDALVFFDVSGTRGVTGFTNLPRPDGEGLVFAPHLYDPGALFGFDLALDIEGMLGAWDDYGDAWSAPVLLGEFGIRADHDEVLAHARRNYDALDALGMHATWWEYSEAAELWNEEDLSLIDGSGVEREEMLDGVVRPYPVAVDGDDLAWSYRAETATFTMTWRAEADGVTEVALPERAIGPDATLAAEGVCGERVGARLLLFSETGGSARLTVSP